MSIDGPPSTPEHAITLRDLRSLTYLTASDIARCANLFGEDHMYTKEPVKFELTNETLTRFGITLHRIRATEDIPSRGVRKGDLGGFVESTHLPSGNARVSGNAEVYGKAWVSGNVIAARSDQ